MPSYDDNAQEAAVLDDALTSSPAGFMADAGALDDALRSTVATTVADDACLNDAVIQVTGYLILESAILNDATQVGATAVDTIDDAGRLGDALTLTLLANFSDTISSSELNDALVSSTVTSVRESAALGDAMTYALSASNNLVEAGTLNDALRSYLSDSVGDAAVLDDAVTHTLRAIDLVVESAVLDDAVSPSTRAVTLVVDVAVLNDAISQTATTSTKIEEDGLLDDRVTGGGAGGAWTAHLETFAMSRWTNQPWNSLAEVGGRLVGASDDGLYFLDAASDAGAAIEASVQYDWLNAKIGRDGKPVASPQLKRPRYLYLEHKGGSLALSLGYVQDGTEATATYELPAQVANAFVNGRVPLGRGIRSVYLKPRIENVDGGDFSVNGGRLAVDELERSIA